MGGSLVPPEKQKESRGVVRRDPRSQQNCSLHQGGWSQVHSTCQSRPGAPNHLCSSLGYPVPQPHAQSDEPYPQTAFWILTMALGSREVVQGPQCQRPCLQSRHSRTELGP